MEKERVCPICGALIERRVASCTGEPSAFGSELRIEYACEDPECGFAVAFPFEGEIYTALASEEIRRRTHQLPADARAEALLNSIAYCGRNGDDALSLELKKELEGIFLDALGEILRDARLLLRALSHREPDPKRKRELREELKIFFDFIEKMEGRFPTPKFEQEFLSIRDGLTALDSAYELGMLALETSGTVAEDYFERGAALGGIRSRVAYVKYVLADRAETSEELAKVKETFRLLAAESQEACYEYVHRAEVGKDDLTTALLLYEEQKYPSLSADGRLAFIRLELSVCIEMYEPALSLLVHSDGAGLLDSEAYLKLKEDRIRAERILAEFSLLLQRISDQYDAILGCEWGDHRSDSGDASFRRLMTDEGNALLEYAIGCAMYYAARLDPKRHFVLRDLRVAIGHLDAFLAYASSARIDLPSIEWICKNADAYRHTLAVWAGLGGEL